MKRGIIFILFIFLLAVPVKALELAPPPAPEDAEQLMPAETESFGQGLLKIIRAAVTRLQPDVAKAAGICISLTAITLVASFFNDAPGNSKSVTALVCTLGIGVLLLRQTGTLIRLGSNTVLELSEYGKLLLPVLTAALAAQGGVTASSALYAGTAVFNSLLGSLVAAVLIPLVYLFLALAIAQGAIGEEILKKIRDFIRWLMTWGLKAVLYLFTGFMTVTGVVSGTADAAAVKAAKLTISGLVPVIGGILSDASEAVVVGAGVVKNAVGIYGLFALTAVWILPFLQIGIHYLMLKLTAAICSVFGVKQASELIGDFSSAMGMLLGMTGTVCFLLMISTVCFMKGMG